MAVSDRRGTLLDSYEDAAVIEADARDQRAGGICARAWLHGPELSPQRHSGPERGDCADPGRGGPRGDVLRHGAGLWPVHERAACGRRACSRS